MDSKLPSLLKPNVSTKFRVDFDWWRKQDRDWRVYLQSFLCPEHQRIYADYSSEQKIDLVEPETGKVSKVDALLHILIDHCAKQTGFIQSNSALVDSIFKIFLSNRNQPLTAGELAILLGKPADVILKTIGTGRVYKGIRPI